MSEIVFPQVSVGEIVDIVTGAKSLCVIGHTNPDGDAVGSSSALSMIARAAGAGSRVVFPNEPQQRLRFLAPPYGYETGAVREDGSVLCSVDVASPNQLGELSGIIPRVRFMIDHHEKGTPFAPFCTDPRASAAGEIVFKVYAEAKRRGAIAGSPEIARRIYAAILSDTGSFAFSNVTPETHRIAAELLEEINGDGEGLSADEINRRLFGQSTLAELNCRMIVTKNLTMLAGGRIAASHLTAREIEEAGATDADAGGAVDVPRSVCGVEAAFTIRQSPSDPREFRVSSRSNSDFDVSAVCASFGGGGHRRAAGCNVYADSPEEAFRAVREAFERAIGAER